METRLTEGDDTYIQPEETKGTGWNDVYGLGGDDVIKAYTGRVHPGPGNDRVERIIDEDTRHWSLEVVYWNAPGPVRANLAEGWVEDPWGGRDIISGVTGVQASHHNDHFVGDERDNFFWGNGGHDTIIGGGGVDGVGMRNYRPPGAEQGRRLQPDEIKIEVSADGRQVRLTDTITNGDLMDYTLTDVEYVNTQIIGSDRWVSIYFIDYLTPQSVAQQTVAAGPEYKWGSGAVGPPTSVTYSFMTEASLSETPSGFRAFTEQERAAVREIFAMTSSATGLTFTEVLESSDGVGQIRFGVSQQSATKGLAYLPGSSDLAGDVLMDVESMMNLYKGSEGYEALLHEIGHALGLRHPRNVDAGDTWDMQALPTYDHNAQTVMSSVGAGNATFRTTWGPLDWAALQYLYGVKPSFPEHTYHTLSGDSFTAKTTLIDDGGSDTLDASLSPVGVYLDIRPGGLSSVGLNALGQTSSQNLGLGTATVIERAVGTQWDDVFWGNAEDNKFWLQAGNDWIDGGAGIDTVVLGAASSGYLLSFGIDGVTVAAKNGLSGFSTLKNVEFIEFPNKLIPLETKTHAGYEDLPESLYHFFIVAFSAAPGVTYMDQLAEAYRYGLTIEQIVDAFITKPQFTDVYPTSLSAAELSSRLVENIVKTSASDEVKAAAARDLEDAFALGWSRGKVIYTVFGNLASKPLSDPVWGNTARFFQNEIAVAKYYTETLNQSTTDLQTLRNVLSAITFADDVSTEAALQELISEGLLVGVTSQADSGGGVV